MSEPSVTSKGGLDRLRKIMSDLAKESVTVGFHDPEASRPHPETGTPIGEVAKYMEFGTRHIPARPFMRMTKQMHGDKLVRKAATLMRRVVQSKLTHEQAVEELGKAGVRAVRKTITDADQWAAPLAIETIQRKNSWLPLVDTGTMRKSVTWVRRTGGLPSNKGNTESND